MSAVLEKSESKVPKIETKAPRETAESVAELQKLSDTLAAFKNMHGKEPDCSTDEGYEQAKARRNAARAVLKSAEESHRVAKAFYLKNGRTVDAMKNDVIAVAEPIRKANHEAMKVVDNAKKEAEAEAARVEQEKQDAIDQAIADIKALDAVVDLDSVITNIDAINNMDLQAFSAMGASDDQILEYENAAEAALTTLVGKQTELQAQADKAAELAEQQRRLDEQAAKQKAEADEREAKLQQQQDEIEAKQKALDDAERERQIKADAEAEAEAEKKAEAERVQAQRIADAEQAEQDKAAAIQAERERIEAEQAAEQKRVADEKAEADKLAAMAPDADKLRAWVDSIPELPDMKTQGGKKAAEIVMSELLNIGEAISDFQHTVKSKRKAA